jgi:hypothetical protein
MASPAGDVRPRWLKWSLAAGLARLMQIKATGPRDVVPALRQEWKASAKDATMTDGYPDGSDSRGDSRWSPEFVWSTLLVLVIGAGVLLWAYFGPRTLSPAYRATDAPAVLTPTMSGR